MTTQTKQVLIINDEATVKDDEEIVATLKLERTTINIQEYQHSKEKIAPLWTYLVDFSGIPIPTFISLVADWILTMTLDTGTIVDVTSFQMEGAIPTISLYNPDTVKSVDVNFLLSV